MTMTSRTSAIDSYLKRVTRELVCFHSTKKRFTAGLKQEFCEQPEEADPVRLFGEPGALAASLQEDVDPSEELTAKRIKRCAIIACVLAAVVLLAGLFVYLDYVLSAQPTRVVETIYDVEYFEIE